MSVLNKITVAWGDCDSAGIVYYPTFFHYFDICTWNLLYSVGLGRDYMQERYNYVVYPAAEVSARFMIPCKFRDELEIESEITEWREKFFKVYHTVRKEGQVALIGDELRFLGIADPEDRSKLRAAVIPQEVIDRFPKPE